MAARSSVTKKAAAAATPAEEPISPGKVKRLIIRNFRAIGSQPVTIDLDNIVVLVGPNNAGKSSILRAYEAIMQDGSSDGKLSEEDFHNRQCSVENPTVIELHTVVSTSPPSSKWVTEENGELIVKERWIWTATATAQGKREGWNTQLEGGAGWDPSSYPWGPPNVANARRPQPHWVKAFDTPEDQEEKINKLITTMMLDKAKTIPASNGELRADGTPKTEFEVIFSALQSFQDAAFDLAKADVTQIEDNLTDMVSKVFAGHEIKFSLHPPVDKDIKLFSAGSSFTVGHKDGHKGPLKNQGSGARRTILWSVLRVLSERASVTSERPRVLLIDEPELCLHPDAVREACQVLYNLAENAGWQVIVTTHSPVFIDLSRGHTNVVCVKRDDSGSIGGTTLFKPSTALLTDKDKEDLKILNLYDPYVAEFFFGGRVVVVEGDTEYSAFKYLSEAIKEGKISDATYADVANTHIVRARGKDTIASLCKILNHFGTKYSVLHDSDTPTITTKKGRVQKSSAWSANQRILDVVNAAPNPNSVRVVASLYNFELAFLGEAADTEKPYNAVRSLKDDTTQLDTVYRLFKALTDHSLPLPNGAINARDLNESLFEEEKAA